MIDICILPYLLCIFLSVNLFIYFCQIRVFKDNEKYFSIFSFIIVKQSIK